MLDLLFLHFKTLQISILGNSNPLVWLEHIKLSLQLGKLVFFLINYYDKLMIH